MKPIGEVLSNPDMGKGLIAEENINWEERINRMLANRKPRETKSEPKVTSPDQCMYSFTARCENCGQDQCKAEVGYRTLLKNSGLIGIELSHTFQRARIDKFNKKLYDFLMAWEPNGGIYIVAGKGQGNPQGNGTGKSYALHALTHRLCREGIACLYARTVDFLAELKASFDEGTQESEARVLSRYINVPVLLWDDLGKESFKTTWAPHQFYWVIDYRIRVNRPMIFSSNFSLDEIVQKFGEENYGPAIASRLDGYCQIWTLGGPDRRIQGQKGA